MANKALQRQIDKAQDIIFGSDKQPEKKVEMFKHLLAAVVEDNFGQVFTKMDHAMASAIETMEMAEISEFINRFAE